MSYLTHKMHGLLRVLALALVLTASIDASAEIERGQKTFGVKAGYVTRNRSMLAGITMDYAFSRHFRVAPAIGLVFRNAERDAMLIDLDFNFPVSTWWTSDFYPILGMAYNSWARHDLEASSHDDVTSHQNAFGLNAGAGWQIRISDSLRLGFEGRYTLIRHNPNGQFAVRLAYVF